MGSRLGSGVIFVCLAFTGAALAKPKQWIEVRSPHFRVLTDGSQGDGRRVAFEFEQLHFLFAEEYPTFRLETGAPLLVFAAHDEETAKSLEPQLWKTKGPKPAGLFHHGWEKQYVMVRLDRWGQGAHEVVYHEYAHSILHANAHWLPTWLDEGMAEFYAYTRFEDHDMLIGVPTERYSLLKERPLIPVETLITMAPGSPHYRDESQIQMFYAESWALVHYLTFGPGMEGGKRVAQYFNLLQQGVDEKKAFQQAVGSFPEVDKGLQLYLMRFGFTAAKVKNAPQIDQKDFTSRTLSVAETDAELAGYHLWTHDSADARPLVEEAIKEDPKLGYAHEERGFLLFADGRDAEAADEFSQAYALDGTLYLSLFSKTMLSPAATSNLPADQNALHDAMEKVLQLDPQFSPVYIQLARLALRQDDPTTAFGLSRKAEELDPWLAGYHLLTAQALLRMGRDAEAASFSEYVAERWFGPDHDEAVALWNSIPVAHRPNGVSLTETLPQGTQSITGTIKSVTCGGPEKQLGFVVDDHGRQLTFHTKGPFAMGFSDTIWYGEDHFNLCHHLEGMRTVVRYRAPADGTYTGDAAEIEIRDDLIAPATGSGSSSPATP